MVVGLRVVGRTVGYGVVVGGTHDVVVFGIGFCVTRIVVVDGVGVVVVDVVVVEVVVGGIDVVEFGIGF